tara:strand:- start:14811 stop:15236 length:426 start_codon:yes stop_codon:yes gene_type:complete
MPGIAVPKERLEDLAESFHPADIQFVETIRASIIDLALYLKETDPNLMPESMDKIIDWCTSAWNDGFLQFVPRSDDSGNKWFIPVWFDDVEQQYEIGGDDREIGEKKVLIDLNPEGNAVEYTKPKEDDNTDEDYFIGYHPN